MLSRFVKTYQKRSIHYLRDTNKLSSILTDKCLGVIEEVHKKNKENYNLVTQQRLESNTHKQYDFREDTAHIRNSEWQVDLHPKLTKRNVEITGPGNNSRMVINAFNSGADGYMLDLEDSMTPSWANVITSQHNIKNAVRGELKDTKFDKNGKLVKEYSIDIENSPTFFVRTRGLHMTEEHVIVDNKPIPATLFDLVTFMFHNGKYLNEQGRGPFLYIPKLESYEEAC